MSDLTERLTKAQKICNDILTHKQPVLAMPVPASEDDQDIFVYRSFRMAMERIERLETRLNALVDVSDVYMWHQSNEGELQSQIDQARTVLAEKS